jgi:hypothetical protein
MKKLSNGRLWKKSFIVGSWVEANRSFKLDVTTAESEASRLESAALAVVSNAKPKGWASGQSRSDVNHPSSIPSAQPLDGYLAPLTR